MQIKDKKKWLIIIAGLLLLATGSALVKGIADYRRGVNVLKNTHLIFMCPLQKGFNLLPNINPFTRFDCSQDYPGKQKQKEVDGNN